VRAQGDNRCATSNAQLVRTNSTRRFQPIYLRHHYVHKNEPITVLLDFAQRFRTIVRGVKLHPILAEPQLGELQHDRIVFDYKDEIIWIRHVLLDALGLEKWHENASSI